MDAAARTPFHKAPTPVRSHKVRLLATAPRSKQGEKVAIEGRLADLTIVHRARKAISTASVVDADGNKATIVLPYIKLDSGGIVNSSWVKVNGIWSARSNETGQPGLMIDRLNFDDLGKASWSHWATRELYPIFTAVPHGLAAEWSWEPGVEGPGNQLRYATWFRKQ